ncbi:MAG: histidinol-phosphate transaminase [Mycobacteriaceae bacterium]
MTVRLRPDLAGIPSYVPGKNWPGAIKLASNETTSGPLPSVVAAIGEAAKTLNRYPDNAAVELVTRLAQYVNVEPKHVAVGCGSVSLCQQLVHITCSQDDEVLFAWRSFEAYPLVTKVAGAVPVQVPLTSDYVHDLKAMATAVTERTRLIFVCNPNNPTGTIVDPQALNEFLDSVPPHILIALDEAYIEYVRTNKGDTNHLSSNLDQSISIACNRPNVVVIRTFSKAYGLAGLRVGYAVSNPEVIAALGKAYIAFSVNSLAQTAAIASLNAAEELLERTNSLIAERTRVHNSLQTSGLTDIPESHANFLWLPLGARSNSFAAASSEAGILVRPFANDGVRVTIGEPQENDAFLEFAQTWIANNKPV